MSRGVERWKRRFSDTILMDVTHFCKLLLRYGANEFVFDCVSNVPIARADNQLIAKTRTGCLQISLNLCMAVAAQRSSAVYEFSMIDGVVQQFSLFRFTILAKGKPLEYQHTA